MDVNIIFIALIGCSFMPGEGPISVRSGPVRLGPARSGPVRIGNIRKYIPEYQLKFHNQLKFLLSGPPWAP